MNFEEGEKNDVAQERISIPYLTKNNEKVF